jgi:hypothetical protein
MTVSSEKGRLEPGQQPDAPTKIASPSEITWVNPEPIRSGLNWPPAPQPGLSPAAAVELDRVQAEAAEKASAFRIKQRDALSEQQLGQVRAYAAEVAAAVRAAAALKPGPLAPLHLRQAARSILHGGVIPLWADANHDATVLELFMLGERGRSYTHGGLDALTAAGRKELDAAETACYNALIARARIVAGEV